MIDVVYVLWYYSVGSYYVAPGENFKAKAWERICRRQLLLHKLFTRNYILFFFTPQLAPMGRTIIEVKSILQLQLHLVCKYEHRSAVKMGSKPQLQPLQETERNRKRKKRIHTVHHH